MYGVEAKDIHILWAGIILMKILRFEKGTPQYWVLEHAVLQYGDRLYIEPNRMTVTTLQGNTETGWIVYGRGHGGSDVGVVFPSKQEAQDTINTLKLRVDFK